MIDSNEKQSQNPPFKISPDVQRLLEKGREHRLVEQAIDEKLTEAIASLREAYPTHVDLIISKLEGYAHKLHSEIEAERRRERQGWPKK